MSLRDLGHDQEELLKAEAVGNFQPEITELVSQLKHIYEGDPKVFGLATWSENCKWYSSLPLGAVVSLFCESD
jgi:hypothetical protein